MTRDKGYPYWLVLSARLLAQPSCGQVKIVQNICFGRVPLWLCEDITACCYMYCYFRNNNLTVKDRNRLNSIGKICSPEWNKDHWDRWKYQTNVFRQKGRFRSKHFRTPPTCKGRSDIYLDFNVKENNSPIPPKPLHLSLEWIEHVPVSRVLIADWPMPLVAASPTSFSQVIKEMRARCAGEEKRRR